MLLRRYYDDTLAQASYLIACQATGEALVVDPLRDADLYLDAAAGEGVQITHVTETHVHADFASGSRELAARTGARLYLSAMGGQDWSYRFAERDGAVLLEDQETFQVGNIRIRALHTPGHTPEHLSFLVTDTATSEHPLGLLSGDFVFVGDVGRPDLLEKAAGVSGTMEAGARDLYRSLQRMAELPDHLQIWPGHGAGSACGKALGAVPTSTLGYERLVGWAFQQEDEASFVRAVLEDQPEPPAYFARMKRMNRDGPALLGHLPEPGHVGNAILERALLEGTQVVDLRSTEAFAGGHVPGTVSIPLNRSFTNWAGSLLSYEEPLYLVAEDEPQARDAARDLALIGFDGVAGYVGPEAVEYWESHKGGLATAPVVSVAEARRLQEAGAVLVDVRARSEVVEGRPAGAIHIHLGSLPDAADELPRDRPVLVSCLTGARAGIGQSLLLARGLDAVKVGGGWQAWAEEGLPVDRG